MGSVRSVSSKGSSGKGSLPRPPPSLPGSGSVLSNNSYTACPNGSNRIIKIVNNTCQPFLSANSLRNMYSCSNNNSSNSASACDAAALSNYYRCCTCSRYLEDVRWRICNAVNIYVFKNGEEGQTPKLIHIPAMSSCKMCGVMREIRDRICFDIGYPCRLYEMCGRRVRRAGDLENYGCYVVASNYEPCFKCVAYCRSNRWYDHWPKRGAFDLCHCQLQ